MNRLILIIVLLFPYLVFSQTISGKVTNENNESLIGANVFWVNTTVGTSTDVNGEFSLVHSDSTQQKIVASFIGQISDTIIYNGQSKIDFVLQSTQTLNEVNIKEDREDVIISNIRPIKVEQITQGELKKAACCDLAGCFETQTTVQPNTTNIITNSKELRILGLRGTYTQILVDGFPMIQGLTNTYGISSIPGTLVGNIFVSKGANSVLQGYEGFSGQINILTRQPDNTDQLLLNAYINSFAEKQFNVNYAVQKRKWSNLTAAHIVLPAQKIDKDNDLFLDLPLLNRYMIFNKLKYGNENEWGWHSTISIRFHNEKRVGGQTTFNQKTDQGSDQVYGQVVNINQPEIWAKAGYKFNEQHNFSIYASSFYQNQNSYFGTLKYDAEQLNFYANAQYGYTYKTHDLKVGLSYKHLNIKENIEFTSNSIQRTYDGFYQRNENISGAFIENTMQFFDNKLTWIAGVRADYHNQFKFQFTPRTLLKYNVTPTTTIRANFGTAWRTVNLFSENIQLLISSRDILFVEDLQPEKAFNTGINVTQKFETNVMKGSITADYYLTSFQNQIFPDYDSDPSKAIIKNFTGKSYSQVFQADLFLEFWSQLEFKFGYTNLDVYRINGDDKVLLPFNPKHKITTSLGYTPKSKKFRADINAHWLGKKRLPNTQSNPIEYQRPYFSEPYTILNAQFTFNLTKVELYFGCENILNFRQNRPFISYDNPFNPYFDTSSAWGPNRGREFYIGIKYRIPKK